MKRVCFAILALSLLACAPAAAAPDPLDALPDGIAPTTASVSQVLKSYEAATGTVPPGTADTRSESWTFVNAGLSGSETLLRSGTNYYARLVSGALVDEYGSFFGKAWHRDQNGVVSELSSTDYTSFEMLLFMHSFGDAEDPKNDVRVLGEVTDPYPCYLVSVTIPGEKHAELVYYDKSSGLVDRIVRVVDGTRVTTTYDDYRASRGRTEPWHIHIQNGDTLLDEDFKRQSLNLGVAISPAQFAQPPSTTQFVSYSGPESLPAHVLWDVIDVPAANGYHEYHSPNVVVRVIVNGRGLDFALSTGQPDTLIDFDVAQQLGLTSQNQVTHDKAGNPVEYDTVIPQAQIGGVTLKNFAVHALPFHYHLNDETKIVGVLGYDLLASGVFKIDFINGTVDVLTAQEFRKLQPVTGALDVPVDIDGGRPYARAAIAGNVTNRVLLDNDFDFSVVFGGFMQRYPGALQDLNGKTHVSDAVLPFADSHGYGKEAKIWLGNIPELDFGSAQFIDFKVMADDVPADLETDAILGGDVLSYYDLYVDYADKQIILKPNKRFFYTFKVEPPK